MNQGFNNPDTSKLLMITPIVNALQKTIYFTNKAPPYF